MEKENAKMNEDFERLPVYEEEEENLDELNRQEVRETKENETCKENVESTESADIRIGKYVCIMEELQNQIGAQRQQMDTAVNLISQMMLSVESGKKQISSEIKELYSNQERIWNVVQQISNRQAQLDAAIDRLQRDDKVQNQQTASVPEVQKLLEEIAGKLHEDIGNLEKKNTDILRDSINFQANMGRRWGDELKHYRDLFADSAYDSILEELADLYSQTLQYIEETESDQVKEDIQDTVIESLNEIFNEFHITISRTKVGEKRSSKTCRTRKTIQTGNEALHGTVAKSYNPSFVRENRVLKYEKIDTYMFDSALRETEMQEEQIQDSSATDEQVEALKNNEQQQDNN